VVEINFNLTNGKEKSQEGCCGQEKRRKKINPRGRPEKGRPLLFKPSFNFGKELFCEVK